MIGSSMRVAVYGIAQIVAVSAVWYFTVLNYEWNVVQQFIGHLLPGTFLAAMGVAAMYLRHNLKALYRREAWLAIIAGGIYVVGDTFWMHPPLGVFDGAGLAEEEHVSLMGLVFVLGVSCLVVLRKMPAAPPNSVHFLIGAAMVAMVFLNHHQHTQAGAIGHSATLILLGAAALFRVLDKIVEYAIAMIVCGFVFFSSQMGFAMYVDAMGNSGSAWVALWAMLGFVSATGFLAMAPADPVAAE